MTGRRIDDWTHLAGRTICVRRGSRYSRIGKVEAVTPKADMLWMLGDGVEPRVLFEKSQGYTAWTVTEREFSAPIEQFVLTEGRAILQRPTAG